MGFSFGLCFIVLFFSDRFYYKFKIFIVSLFSIYLSLINSINSVGFEILPFCTSSSALLLFYFVFDLFGFYGF